MAAKNLCSHAETWVFYNVWMPIISLIEQKQTRSWCLYPCLWGCQIYWCIQKKVFGCHLENPKWLPQSSILHAKSFVQGIETWSWCLNLCLGGRPIYWCWQKSAGVGGHLGKSSMAAKKLTFARKITCSSDKNIFLESLSLF